MSQSRNTPLLLALVICILVVVGALAAAIFLAAQKPLVVVIPAAAPADVLGPPAAAPAAPQTVALTGAPSAPAVPAVKPPEVNIIRASAVPALADVFDPAWERVPATDVPLQPQQTAPPMLATATIESMTVQAVHDGRRIAWRMSWPAPRPAIHVETGQFTDAVAIQIPMVDGAPFTMGAKDMPVRLLMWRALWQKDLDDGFQDVYKLYPNAWSDMDNLTSIDTRQYLMPLAAGNPMAALDRKQPVEELVAEGFGTATHVPDSPSSARGAWRDGRWTVVIDRPLSSADPLAARLQSAPTGMVAFAIWDGAAANRGGAKHHCNWIAMRIEQ